jgi:hypothetical protein
MGKCPENKGGSVNVLILRKEDICPRQLQERKSVPIRLVHAKPNREKSSVQKLVPSRSLPGNVNADILTADTRKVYQEEDRS